MGKNKVTTIISRILVILVSIFSFCCLNISVWGQETENQTEVSDFRQLQDAMSEFMSTGGVITLTQDIIVPADESYTYNNGRYRQEILVKTQGHTIYVEGSLTLWPYLTVQGDGSTAELFHISSGGELRMVSITLDAGEQGTAVVQEEGSILAYGSEEGMGLPVFSCSGQMINAETYTAAAYFRYDMKTLPLVRLPEGTQWSSQWLPDTVLASVNRDYKEFEEEIPVVWDQASIDPESERILISGSFGEGYTQYEDYAPQCLLIWESDTAPFFLNVYLQALTPEYDVVFMYGEAPQAGEVRIQGSQDGENWEEITGTEGYQSIYAEAGESLEWMLQYPQQEGAVQRPRYYRLMQIQEDGSEYYSGVLELSEGLIYTAGDIEGGRGGETSPEEGENLLPDRIESQETEQPEQVPEPTEEISQENSWEIVNPENTSAVQQQPTDHGEESSAAVITPAASASEEPQEKITQGETEERIVSKEEEISPAEEQEQILETAPRRESRIPGIPVAIFLGCLLLTTIILVIWKKRK